jgi:hypothetical protein
MSTYISIAEAQDHQLTAERIHNGEPAIFWGMRMPAHLDLEKIQIRTDRLNLIHKVGAFAASSIHEYQGDTTQSNSIAGINPDGSAVAGATVTKKQQKSKSQLLQPPIFEHKLAAMHYGKPTVMHIINRPELVQNVISHKEKGNSDEQAWARELDSAIRGSFRNAGKAHLKDRIGAFRKTASYYMAGVLPYDLAKTMETGEPSIYPAAYLGLLSLNAVVDSYLYKRYTGDPQLDQRRWSLMLQNQADRYVALAGLSRIPGLIRVAS